MNFRYRGGAWEELRKVKFDNLFDFSYFHISLFCEINNFDY